MTEISETIPKIIEDEKQDRVYHVRVILFNDEVNTFPHVESCLMKICFKSKKEAKRIAMEAHSEGKATCYQGSLEECETVADKLATEKLTVSIES